MMCFQSWSDMISYLMGEKTKREHVTKGNQQIFLVLNDNDHHNDDVDDDHDDRVDDDHDENVVDDHDDKVDDDDDDDED